MPQFILLLHDRTDDAAEISPEEIQAIIARYSAWSDRVAASGHLVGGHKLTDEGGRHVSRQDGEVRIVDGPYSEVKEIIGGLFILEAESYEEAAEISRTCPHLDHGWIEVRQIDQV